MSGSPQTKTLVGSAVTTVTLDRDYDLVEVLNVTGTAEVYFRCDGVDPVVGADQCQMLPAAISAVEVKPGTAGAVVVKLISLGTPKVSVRGL